MQAQKFQVLKRTSTDHLLLECRDVQAPAISKPTKVFLGRKHILTITDTIASVKDPYYLAKAAPGQNPESLIGKAIEIPVPSPQ